MLRKDINAASIHFRSTCSLTGVTIMMELPSSTSLRRRRLGIASSTSRTDRTEALKTGMRTGARMMRERSRVRTLFSRL